MKKEWQDATQRGDCKQVQQLLEDGVDVDSLDKYGQTALMNAAHRGDSSLIKLLIKHGAALDLTGKYRLTALMLAVIKSHKGIVKLLVDAGANTALVGSKPFDCTPLEYAEKHGFIEITSIFKSGSKVKYRIKGEK